MTALSEARLALFEEFWRAYPYRPENPKAEARRVFLKLLGGGENAEVLIAAAGRYQAFCRKAGKQAEFVPYASTWLRQRRFEDFADAPESAAPAQPAPEHPLAFLIEVAGLDTWKSWIERVRVDAGDAPAALLFPTQIALDHVRRKWGAEIRAHFGDVVWALQPKDQPWG